MAVTPLFNATLDIIKLSINLPNATSVTTLQMISDAVAQVKVLLYSRLGETIITEVLNTAFTENPTTAAERQRSAANLIETKWVKMLLLKSLDNVFIDSTADSINRFNDEGLTREKTQTDILIESIQEEIDELLGVLSTTATSGNDTQSATIAPTTAPPRPFDSTAVYVLPLLTSILNVP